MGLLAKILKAMNSESSPWQLSYGFALGLIMGLTPLLGLHSILIILLVLFLRVNVSAFLVSWSFFSLIALPLNSLFSQLGETLLTQPSLNPMWTTLYNSYFGQLLQFYHTTTLGSLLVSLLLFVPFLFLSKKLIEIYRERFMQWVNQIRLVQLIKGSNFYQLYQGLRG